MVLIASSFLVSCANAPKSKSSSGSAVQAWVKESQAVLSDEGKARIAIGIYLIKDYLSLDTNTVIFVNLNDDELEALSDGLTGYQLLPILSKSGDASFKAIPGQSRKVEMKFFSVEINNGKGRASVLFEKTLHCVVRINKADTWRVEGVDEGYLDY